MKKFINRCDFHTWRNWLFLSSANQSYITNVSRLRMNLNSILTFNEVKDFNQRLAIFFENDVCRLANPNWTPSRIANRNGNLVINSLTKTLHQKLLYLSARSHRISHILKLHISFATPTSLTNKIPLNLRSQKAEIFQWSYQQVIHIQTSCSCSTKPNHENATTETV